MKKLAYAIAAICALSIAAAPIASAETVVVKHHHGWHPWHHHDRTVIIKHHRD